MQVTALGNPKLLERVSGALIALQNLFSQFDMDMNNTITREEFSQVLSCAINDAASQSAKFILPCKRRLWLLCTMRTLWPTTVMVLSLHAQSQLTSFSQYKAFGDGFQGYHHTDV